LRDAIERGDIVSQLGVRTGRCNLAWLIAGRPEEARAQLAAAEASLTEGFHMPRVLAIQAACNIDLFCGDAASAADRMEAAWPQIDRIGVLRLQHLRCEMSSLRARIALADTRRPIEERIKMARGVSEDLIKEGAPWATALGLLLRASTQAFKGDLDGALVTLHAAENHLLESDMQGWLGVARLRRAALEGGPGGAARAEAARDLLKDLGAANPDQIAALLVPWPS
jgi:hypothetical protein